MRTFAAAAAAANAPVKLPDLPYGYGELEPVIAGGKIKCISVYLGWGVLVWKAGSRCAGRISITEIMELHHKKHHQAYVTNFNAALEKLAAAEVSEPCLD